MIMRPVMIFMLFSLVGCASFLGSDKPASEPEVTVGGAGAPLPAKVTPLDAIELRVAQLWSKVDDLEAQLLQQKERSKLLERGLLLGIVPEELKDADKRPLPRRPEPSDDSALKLQVAPGPLVDASPSHVASSPAPLAQSKAGSHDRTLYRKLLQEAQDKFNRANYGQAIVAFNDIGAKFDDEITEGSHHYWVGLSWFYLKEFKLSEESFNAFKNRYPSNPWNAHAAFYLAKIAQSRGLHQRAMDQFQKILDENPDRDLGEMAKAEIQRMKEQL